MANINAVIAQIITFMLLTNMNEFYFAMRFEMVA